MSHACDTAKVPVGSMHCPCTANGCCSRVSVIRCHRLLPLLSSGVACNRRSAKVPNWLPAAALHVSHGTAPSCPRQRCSCRDAMSLYDTWSIQCIPVRVIHSASAFTPIKPSLHVLARRIRMHVCVSFIEPSCVCHSCVCPIAMMYAGP